MTRTRWFRPVLGLVLALAVGVAAALVAMRFAPPQQVLAEPAEVQTALAPVLEPITEAPDGDAELPTSEPADGVFPISDPIGTGTIVVPAPEGEEDLGDREAADLVEAEAASEGAGLLPRFADLFGGLDLPLPTGLGGDPCAPAEGDPAEDCPEGARSVVLSLTREEIPFMVLIRPNPATSAAVEAGFDPAMGRVCDAPVDAHSVNVMIMVTRPATVQYSAIRVDDAREGEIVTGGGDMVRTSDEQRAAFERSLTVAETFEDIEFPWWCVTLSDLEDGRYWIYPIVTDDEGNTVSDGINDDFVIPRENTRPDILVKTVGDNLVLATALHARDEDVDMRAYVSPDGHPVYSCPDNDSGYGLEQISVVEGPAGRALRAGLGVGDELNRKTVAAYRVPEGSYILFCAVWFPDGDEPSWVQEQDIYWSTRGVRSPDRILPVVTVRAVTPNEDSGIRNMNIIGSSVEGSSCGVAVPWARGADFDERVLCDGDEFADAGVTSGGGYLRSAGFSGDLAVRVSSTYDEGESVENWAYIRLADQMCRGECRLPSSRHYFVPIGSPGGDAACGVFSGLDCQAATVDRVGGSVMIKVSWTQGNQNGLDDWDIGWANRHDYGVEEVTGLRFDRTATWQLGPLDPATLTYEASLDVRFNQPAGYRMSLIPVEHSAPECVRIDLPWTDAPVPGVERVRVPGLCPGGEYRTVILAGATEDSITWYEDSTGAWWDDAELVVPQIPVRLIWAVGVEGDPGDKVRRLDILLDDQHLDIREMQCVSGDGTYYADGDIETTLTNMVDLGGRVDIRKQPPCVDLEPRQAGPTDLDALGTVFPLRDLLEDGGIEYRMTSQGDTIVLRVKAFLAG